MNDELERRIQRALDAGQKPEDTELGSILEEDAEAARVARELSAVDAWLREWGADHVAPEADLWVRVEARLDEVLPPLDDDPLAPPVFAEDEGPTTAPVAAAAPLAAPVDLAERRRRRAAGWWIAAAAVVGLAATGAIVGLRTEAGPQELAMSDSAARELATHQPAAEEDHAEPSPAPTPREAAPRAAAVPAGSGDEVEASEEARGGAREVLQAAGEPARGGLPGRRRTRRSRPPLAIQSVDAEEVAAAPPRTAAAAERPRRDSGRTLARVRACVVPGGPPVLELTAVVDRRTGRVTDVRAPGLREETRRCLRRALRDERFAGAAASGSTEVRLRYRLRD